MRTLNTIRGASMNMYELSPFRRDVIELAEVHFTEIQEIVANECRIINSNREGKHTAGVPLVLYNLIPPKKKWMFGYILVNN